MHTNQMQQKTLTTMEMKLKGATDLLNIVGTCQTVSTRTTTTLVGPFEPSLHSYVEMPPNPLGLNK
jgi:hypothetical protein